MEDPYIIMRPCIPPPPPPLSLSTSLAPLPWAEHREVLKERGRRGGAEDEDEDMDVDKEEKVKGAGGQLKEQQQFAPTSFTLWRNS
eukprot:754432-Hanusia_phi.AAC.1